MTHFGDEGLICFTALFFQCKWSIRSVVRFVYGFTFSHHMLKDVSLIDVDVIYFDGGQ